MHLGRSKAFKIKVEQGTAVPCFYFYFTSSTNYLAKVFVSENTLSTPVVISAKEQSQGRGRYDRSFLSPKGGVYMSYITPANENLTSWSFYSAVAVVRALTALGVSEDRISIKWPNDVKIDGKKVCGILPESVVTDKRYAVIGIGVNVNTDMKHLDPVKDIATSVYTATGKKASLIKTVKSISKELYSLISNEDDGAILDEYKSRCETIGREVRTDDGFTGVAVDLDKTGSLILDKDGERKEVFWGEVCYVK